jgi:hypothetical protein
METRSASALHPVHRWRRTGGADTISSVSDQIFEFSQRLNRFSAPLLPNTRKQLLEFTFRRIRFEKRVSRIARTQHTGFSSVPKGLLASSSELLLFHGLGASRPHLITYLPKVTNRSAPSHGAAASLQNSDLAVRRGLGKQDETPWHVHRP